MEEKRPCGPGLSSQEWLAMFSAACFSMRFRDRLSAVMPALPNGIADARAWHRGRLASNKSLREEQQTFGASDKQRI